MKLTNGEVFSAREPLMKLLEERLPVKCSYKLAKLANKLESALKAIEKVRSGLVKKHGEKNEKGQMQVKEGSAGYDLFVDEFNELMALEVEIIADKVQLPEDLTIEPRTLMALEKFIEV